jgi:hypothetical protein
MPEGFGACANECTGALYDVSAVVRRRVREATTADVVVFPGGRRAWRPRAAREYCGHPGMACLAGESVETPDRFCGPSGVPVVDGRNCGLRGV